MKKFFLSLFCALLVSVTFIPYISTSAAEDCTITIATVKGNIGETVYVPVTIKNNPGISAITVTFTYDANALEFIKHSKGPAFTDNLMLKAHPDKNQIKIALIESTKDSTNDDVILTFHFKIKEKATAEVHKIGLTYGKGDFANRKMESVMPKIKTGGVDVAYNLDAKNCPHKTYGEWKIAVKPLCTKGGIDQRVCNLCGHIDTRETEPAGHTYENEWTVDVPAKKDREGVMSRHCKYCTSTVDSITFTLNDSEKENINNSIGTEINNEFTKNQFEEQYPGETLTGKEESSSVTSSVSENIGSSETTASSKTEISDSASTLSSKEEETNTDNSFFKENKLLILIVGIILIVILLVIIAVVAVKK